MDHAPVEDLVTAAPIRIVLASMPEMLEKIVRDFLAGVRDMQIDDEVASLHNLSESVPSQRAIVVIEADPPGFAQACEILPNIRLVGITRDWRHVSVRFNDLSEERLRDAIRFVAKEGLT
jgi:hypothetical protein